MYIEEATSAGLLGSGMIWILFFISIGITLIAQLLVKSRYNKYKQISNNVGMTGEQVARSILDSNGLHNVQILQVDRELGDNYNPSNKTVNLSPAIYSGSSVASLAVAAHAGYAMMLEIAIVVQFVTLLFELVTLPVEFDASARALKQLKNFNLFSTDEVGGATSMLKACALTYVGALLTTLVQVLRLILMLQSSRRRR